ncbi:hypothetical protein H0H81_009949 [Sphagnurus paluster]|uniref:F-box domain-containing protein n=1 Tax=Sphagnurus paluster TaxID=117069 RepID=A0A9P7KHZ1_9AGAR|nr:hypothetical protein H0H81_009949 [Sphagnurus paluster]
MLSYTDILLSYTDLLHKLEFEAGVSNVVCLSRSERRIAREIITETEARIARLENELSKERLLLERCRVALAPHKDLPPKLIREIFLHTETWAGISIPNSKSWLHISHWALRQICASWRIIALEQPQLWSNFHLRADKFRDFSLSEAQLFFRFLCKDILHLTGPVRIDGGDLPHHFAPLMRSEIVLPNIHRFSELSLTNNSAMDISEYLSLPGSSFEILESLMICSRSPSDFLAASKSPPLFDGLKSLRSISFMGSVNEICLSQNIPWHQLTWAKMLPTVNSRFTMSILTSAVILRQCQSLVTLHIGVNAWKEDTRAHLIPPIHLPNLRDLTLASQHSIEELPSVDSTSLLDYLHVPSLTRLDLRVFYDTDRQVCAAISSLIIRSRCNLEELALWDGLRDLENPELPKLLSLLSHMRIMTTGCLSYTESILRSIVRGEILPRLERWAFYGSVDSINLFEEIVKTRKCKRIDAPEQEPSLGVLKVAYMYVRYEDGAAFDQWDKKLQEYGTHFHVFRSS